MAPKLALKLDSPKNSVKLKEPVESDAEFRARINGANAASQQADLQKIRDWGNSFPTNKIPTYAPPGLAAARRQVDTPEMGKLRMRIAELENQITDIKRPYNGVDPWPGNPTYNVRGRVDVSYDRKVKQADTDKAKLGNVYRELRIKQTELAHLNAARDPQR